MARYSISDTTLTALGDAVRAKTGIVEGALLNYHEDNVRQTNVNTYIDLKGAPNNRFKVNLTNIRYFNGAYSFYLEWINPNNQTQTVTITNEESFSIIIDLYTNNLRLTIDMYGGGYIDMDIDIECVDSNDENYFYTPEECIEKINGLNPGPTAEELVLTGDMELAFNNGRFDWMINRYGNLITTRNIYNPEKMFYKSYVKEIPFALNFSTDVSDSSKCSLSSMFYNMSNLEVVPIMNNFKPFYMDSVFEGCAKIREFPDDAFDTWDWTLIDGNTGTSSRYGTMSYLFSSCYSLRKAPMEVLNHGNPKATSGSYHYYRSMFFKCCVLDELVNIPAPKNASITVSANMFNDMVDYCYRLKELTFVPGITLNWSNQVIDLTTQTGFMAYDYTKGDILNYNSGITADKEVKDDATYQALKNDPDWFAIGTAYSRYNHDSAVNTINSLPTMTGTGNTIKFRGEAGSATDGGAINTLTEEEIAVAAAKGWTVSLV